MGTELIAFTIVTHSSRKPYQYYVNILPTQTAYLTDRASTLPETNLLRNTSIAPVHFLSNTKRDLLKIMIKKLWQNPTIFLAYLIVALTLFSYLFFSPQSIPTQIPNSDKIGHIVTFFVLGLLFFKASKLPRRYQILLLAAYGIAVECIQHFIPYRSGDINDVIADATGILLFYALTVLPFIKHKLRNDN